MHIDFYKIFTYVFGTSDLNLIISGFIIATLCFGSAVKLEGTFTLKKIGNFFLNSYVIMRFIAFILDMTGFSLSLDNEATAAFSAVTGLIAGFFGDYLTTFFKEYIPKKINEYKTS